MNEVMCWEVMGLCNILEQSSSLGDWSLNPRAAAFTPFVIQTGGSRGDSVLEGGKPFWEVELNTGECYWECWHRGTGELVSVSEQHGSHNQQEALSIKLCK